MHGQGYTKRQIRETLGVKNDSQIETWVRWYRNGDTHRFEQQVGHAYTSRKRVKNMSELEFLHLRGKELEMQNFLLGKLKGILRK